MGIFATQRCPLYFWKMKKIIIVSAFAFAAIAVFLVLRGPKNSQLGEVSPPPSAVLSPTPSESVSESVTPASGKTVIYTDAGFSPSTVTIKRGETVIFKNNSSEAMWVASAMHPTHDLYPIKGGCVNSAFDQCEEAAPGGSWSFKFDVAGIWKYHNHLNLSKFGSVVVEE
ncbi:MAG: Plastocyanin [Candidatus Giovannonibacteria bacterium GW2011_GWB1_47_6b]|uniref:Plastocyanin n=2 Tax=Parcubacteria group TaxID=1794811 RepID=A0A0G1T3G1_9BACT|nr:MAG: Plastocyanin [Candidatus Giovannonibacteria bacterium GW2011_GWB1_47_6b]